MLTFLLGAWFGSTVTVVMLALCKTAGDADRWEEGEHGIDH